MKQMEMRLKKLKVENFKGVKELSIDFSDVTQISGQNATGKTTVFDALCWLLFGKDSQDREKFDIRTLDENGDKIHNTEIAVTGTFDVDDKEITFFKRQKENWVKKKGSDHSELQGNVNDMEINGYPKSEAEYKQAVADMVDEDVFKILTNPAHFPSLPWKDQRQMLMKFVADMSDVEIAKSLGEDYELLIPDLEDAPDTDAISKKYSKMKKELNDKQKELPVRIDELEKSKQTVDVSELESKKTGLSEKIADIETQIASGAVDTSDLQAVVNAIRSELNGYEDGANEKIREAHKNAQKEVYVCEDIFGKLTSDINRIEVEIREKTEKRNSLKEYANKVKAELDEVKEQSFPDEDWQFDESQTFCSLCGQLLPVDKVDELKRTFTENKANALAEWTENHNERIEKLTADGRQAVETYKELGTEVEKLTEDRKKEKADLADVKMNLEKAQSELNATPSTADFTNDETHKEIVNRLNEAIQAVENARANATDTSGLKADKERLQAELSEIQTQIGKADADKDIDKRIADLTTEQQETAQKVAEAEQMIYLLENFVKAKMERVETAINSKFELVGFKLFQTQINGGIKECCEMTVNGIPYSVLNSGHRIVGGLDVIRAMQGLTGVKVPVWIDNAESVNSYNLPKMDNQLVLLAVTDDKELQIGG